MCVRVRACVRARTSRLWVVGCGLWVVGCGLWVVGCGLWVVGCGLWVEVGCRGLRFGVPPERRRQYLVDVALSEVLHCDVSVSEAKGSG
jgi:hypothetical protein